MPPLDDDVDILTLTELSPNLVVEKYITDHVMTMLQVGLYTSAVSQNTVAGHLHLSLQVAPW